MYGAIAEAGVNAVLLAGAGFQAERRILDRDSGFWLSFGALDFDEGVLVAELGERWFVHETRHKLYPSVRYANAAIELFHGIVSEHGLSPGDVEEVTIVIPEFPRLARVITNDWPDEPLKVAQTLPYALWMVLRGVPPGPAWWDTSSLHDADGRQFGTHVRCIEETGDGAFTDERILAGLDSVPVRVEVSGPRGHWEASADRPRDLTEQDLASKTLAYTSRALGVRGAHRLTKATCSLDQAPSTDDLVHALVAEARR
jgi:2-methylcitrate dehydratase PrpD